MLKNKREGELCTAQARTSDPTYASDGTQYRDVDPFVGAAAEQIILHDHGVVVSHVDHIGTDILRAKRRNWSDPESCYVSSYLVDIVDVLLDEMVAARAIENIDRFERVDLLFVVVQLHVYH